MNFQTSISYLKGVGPSRAKLLGKELGIFTYADLANFFPNRYIDRTQFYKIRDLQINSADVQIVGKITGVKSVKQKRGSRLVAQFVDDTGHMELVWFRGVKWIQDSLKINVPYVIFGKVNFFNGAFNMPHPEMELLSDYKKGFKISMQPVYRSTEVLSSRGVSNRVMQKMQQQLFTETQGKFGETLSEKLIRDQGLISKNEAMFNIHFPQSQELLTKARQRLKFEELFFIQLQLVVKNLTNKRKNKGFVFDKIGDYFNGFYSAYLPFELTGAQKKVVKEIRMDLNTGAQMNRLLQGDVGSGKTIVAVLTMLMALDNAYQTALIAPTEILATQHFNAIDELLAPMNIKVRLLTGSSTVAQRRVIHEELENGSLHIIIGTHAVFEDKVLFKNLGLAIIDEQHRFGVAQRAKMWMKNDLPPHILVMTATPIPRTLAMSVYGDLDISVIDELPPGRKTIKTIHRFDSNRLSVFKFIKDEVGKGRQVYVVYPLIKESEQLDYKDLMDGYESISREFPLPDYRISIVHGKMKSADKEYEMQRFVKGETQIMVATTVIEVGVNVPNASVMVIESSERFGLSQLHQLRGRVGRGADQSYCILLSGVKLTKEAKKRLQTMVETNDGFKIAEVDLELRGPGDLMGTQQSGVLNLKIADIVQDSQVVYTARKAAIQVAHSALGHKDPAYKNIWATFGEIMKNRSIWANIS
ncbi:ATP-dependent DNA helicase RecG [Lutimonas vermicola]|uniref:ATP-dependent DNA helicase RecG n=1 Tax=Lutimonas vermicola TaxID=414288 RepID=A0ABU9KWF1_9FLAO